MPRPHAGPPPKSPGAGILAGCRNLLWPLAALATLLLFNFFRSPGFFHITVVDGHLHGSLIDILTSATPVMIVCLGMTLVIATGGVDLSVGAVMAIAGALAAVMVNSGYSAGSVILAVIAVGLLAGAWNGTLVTALGIQPIIATLILMVSGRGIALLLTDGHSPGFKNQTLEFIGSKYLFGVPFRLMIVVLLMAAVIVLMRKTALGLFVESVGDNPLASRYVGLRVRLITAAVYVIGGTLAALAGLVATSNISKADPSHVGLNIELDAIFAVVIGGTPLIGGRFYLLGSLIGALILQTLTTTILTRSIPVEYTLIVKAVVVLVVCLLQSERFRAMFLRRSVTA